MQPVTLRRQVGLPAAVLILVGYLINGSIFVLPGLLGARAGPALPVSYLVAAALTSLAAVAAVHIGSQLPVSGAVYAAVSRSVDPGLGFLALWAMLAAVAAAIPLMAFGLVEYLAYLVPGIPRRLTAIVVVVLLGGVNLFPVRLAVVVQGVLAAGGLLLLYGIGWKGVSQADPGALSPLFANGIGPALGAAVGAYFSLAGVTGLTSIGEELKRPGRTLPWAVGLGLLLVLAAWLLVTLTVVGTLEWRTLGSVPMPLATAAELFLPADRAWLVPIAAILASVASVNTLLLVHSRDIFAMARQRVFPALLAQVHPVTAVPAAAVVAITLLGLGAVLAGPRLLDLTLFPVLGLMFVQVCAGMAVLQMPSYTSPGRFALKGAARGAVGAGLIVISTAFGVVGALEHPAGFLVFAAVMAAGVLYYSTRRRFLAARGEPLDPLFAPQAPEP